MHLLNPWSKVQSVKRPTNCALSDFINYANSGIFLLGDLKAGSERFRGPIVKLVSVQSFSHSPNEDIYTTACMKTLNACFIMIEFNPLSCIALPLVNKFGIRVK